MRLQAILTLYVQVSLTSEVLYNMLKAYLFTLQSSIIKLPEGLSNLKIKTMAVTQIRLHLRVKGTKNMNKKSILCN